MAKPVAEPLVRLVQHKGETLIEAGIFTAKPRAIPTARGVAIHPDHLGELIAGLERAQADLVRERCNG